MLYHPVVDLKVHATCRNNFDVKHGVHFALRHDDVHIILLHGLAIVQNFASSRRFIFLLASTLGWQCAVSSRLGTAGVYSTSSTAWCFPCRLFAQTDAKAIVFVEVIINWQRQHICECRIPIRPQRWHKNAAKFDKPCKTYHSSSFRCLAHNLVQK